MKQEVIILGGGVIGLSTAILLHSVGYKIKVITQKLMWDNSSDPTFASIYPAASIIPHNIEGDTAGLYKDTLPIFETLSNERPDIVRRQKHLEIGEFEQQKQEYLRLMNADVISEDQSIWGTHAPMRSRASEVYGYGFDILFVEMPDYVTFFKRIFRSMEIDIIKRTIDSGIFEEDEFKDSIFCNCLGLYGGTLVDDHLKMIPVVGILLSLPMSILLQNELLGTPISYNYLFDNLEVYSYPRKKDVLFGGTRIKIDRSLDIIPQLEDHFSNRKIPYRRINGVPVPDHIIDVNLELSTLLYGVTIPTSIINVLVGIRSVREESPRLDNVRHSGHMFPVINCYGFGGAGVTLSWGAAFFVLQEVCRITGESLSYEEAANTLLKTIL